MNRKKLLLTLLLLFLATPAAAEAVDAATGDTLLYVVMIDDMENEFDDGMIETVKGHINKTVDYYEGRAPAAADLDLSVEYHNPSILYNGDYFPAPDREEQEVTVFPVRDALNELGYSGGSWHEATRRLIETKQAAGYDNVAPLFVAPQAGRSYAFPTSAPPPENDVAEFTTVYYTLIEDELASLLGFDDSSAVVYAHELGHLFGGEDEYVETGNTEYGEFTQLPTLPMQRLYPSFNYGEGPVEPEQSIMAGIDLSFDYIHDYFFDWFDIQTPPSDWAEGMWGWRDFDLDGTIDAFDQAIPVEFPADRKPILNARVPDQVEVEYPDFNDVKGTAIFDDAQLVDRVGMGLVDPDGVTQVATARGVGNTTANVNISRRLSVDVPAAEKPGTWRLEYFFGDRVAAWYPIDVLAPLARLAADTVDLGRVEVGTTGEAAYTVSNDGDMQLDLSRPEITSPETITQRPDSSSIPPGITADYDVAVTPQDIGPITGTVTLSTNDPRSPSLSLQLDGVAYLVRYLTADAPVRATVDDDVPVTVGYRDSAETPTTYDVLVERRTDTTGSYQDVTGTDAVAVRTQGATASITPRQYGTYRATVDKPDTQRYEYRSDTATFTVDRLQRSLQLAIDLSRDTVKTGEQVRVMPRADGQTVEAELLVDGRSRGVSDRFTITLEQPGNHTVTVRKETALTDRERRDYRSATTTIMVAERSLTGKVGQTVARAARQTAVTASSLTEATVRQVSRPSGIAVILVLLGLVGYVVWRYRDASEAADEGGDVRRDKNGVGSYRCPKCDSSINQNARYCRNCGTSLLQERER